MGRESLRRNIRYIIVCIGILITITLLAIAGVWRTSTSTVILLGAAQFFVFWKMQGKPRGGCEAGCRIIMAVGFLIAATAIDYGLMTICYFSATVMCIAGIATLFSPIFDMADSKYYNDMKRSNK